MGCAWIFKRPAQWIDAMNIALYMLPASQPSLVHELMQLMYMQLYVQGNIEGPR